MLLIATNRTYYPTTPPTSSPSAEPTASASASAEPTTKPTDAPRTDLSDNRSDGQTGSLGCLKPSDNCNTQVGVAPQPVKELPATGTAEWITGLLILAVVVTLGAGVYLTWKSYQRDM